MVCLSVGKLRDLGNWDAADTEMLFDTLQIRLEAVAQIYQTYYRHVKQKFQCTVANPIARYCLYKNPQPKKVGEFHPNFLKKCHFSFYHVVFHIQQDKHQKKQKNPPVVDLASQAVIRAVPSPV